MSIAQKERLYLFDTTLRDGAQTNGVDFTLHDKQIIAQMLDDLGIDYVDTEPKAREFMQRHGITYPNGPDLGSRISYDYRIKGVPETFVIDKDGVVRFVKIGPTTADELRSALEPLLR